MPVRHSVGARNAEIFCLPYNILLHFGHADKADLDAEDGLDRATLCKCDLVFAVPKEQLKEKRGSVSRARRRAIAEKVIRSLGLAGI